MGFGDFGDVGVRVRVVDLVEGDDGGEFGGHEGRDEGGEVGRGPCFQGGFEGESVESAGDDGGGRAVTRELGLEGVDWVRF